MFECSIRLYVFVVLRANTNWWKQSLANVFVSGFVSLCVVSHVCASVFGGAWQCAKNDSTLSLSLSRSSIASSPTHNHVYIVARKFVNDFQTLSISFFLRPFLPLVSSLSDCRRNVKCIVSALEDEWRVIYDVIQYPFNYSITCRAVPTESRRTEENEQHAVHAESLLHVKMYTRIYIWSEYQHSESHHIPLVCTSNIRT